jgi:hypothetical protein
VCKDMYEEAVDLNEATRLRLKSRRSIFCAQISYHEMARGEEERANTKMGFERYIVVSYITGQHSSYGNSKLSVGMLIPRGRVES